MPLPTQGPRLARPASALSDVTGRIAVRNPSAVASTTDSSSQRRQRLDQRIVNDANAVNVNKRPVRLVRIEKVTGSIAHAHLGVPHALAQLRAVVPAVVGRQSSLEVGRFPDGLP
jgi:hypothetical protein